ncbi:hypothetical protein [Usitatibacter rugosus]|nr:hypothetical protein [Usitatibacter rugosus]
MIEQPNSQPEFAPEIFEAAKRAGYIIARNRVASDQYDLLRPDGSIGAAGLTREKLEAAARTW